MAVSTTDLKKLARTRHIVYLLVAAVAIVPFLVKWDPGEFESDKYAVNFFRTVDSLKPGTRVFISFDFDPGSDAELTPMGVALLRHCFKNDLIPVVMTHYPTGIDLARSTLQGTVDESDELWGKKKESGVDYVFLGFRPGQVNLVLNMGEDLKGAFQTDYYGKATEDMPALKGIQSLKDLELVVCLSASAWVDFWILYGADRFKFKYAAGATAVMVPDLYTFLQSGQMIGLMGGLRGAADYETLLKNSDRDNTALQESKGRGTLGMLAQSASHVLVIVLILVANVLYLSRRLTGREKG